MPDVVNTHSARMALNRDAGLRDWVEAWLRNKERELHHEMSDDDFARHWKYVRPERMHEGAVEAVTAYSQIQGGGAADRTAS